eukprot:15299869-Alexandrium_andersonii.AAC.1
MFIKQRKYLLALCLGRRLREGSKGPLRMGVGLPPVRLGPWQAARVTTCPDLLRLSGDRRG